MLVYVFMAIGEKQVVRRIQTFHSTDKSKTRGVNIEVYSECVLPGYNVAGYPLRGSLGRDVQCIM